MYSRRLEREGRWDADPEWLPLPQRQPARSGLHPLQRQRDVDPDDSVLVGPLLAKDHQPPAAQRRRSAELLEGEPLVVGRRAGCHRPKPCGRTGGAAVPRDRATAADRPARAALRPVGGW